ncbi:MAG: UPF0182 family protein [Alphaproteobacteria bacterium]|nr:UPF0182 family protein [Alphaproteobacteria bacterium]
MTPRSLSPLLLGLLLYGAFLLLQLTASLWVGWSWFDTLGLADVYLRVLGARVGTGLLAAAMVATLAGSVVVWALRLTENRPVLPSLGLQEGGLVRWLRRPGALRRTARQAVAVGALAAFVLGLGHGLTVLAWSTHLPFGLTEPVLGRDVAFHVYTVPVLEAALQVLLLGTWLGLGLGLTVLVVRGALTLAAPDPHRGRPAWVLRADPPARRLVASTVAGLAVLLAVGLLLDRHEALLPSPARPDGPTYTTVHVTLPMLLLRTGAGFVAAGLLFRGFDRLRGGSVLAAIAVVVVAGLAQPVAEGLVQRLVVVPNELELEQPYLAARVTQTRAAWGLDRVEERPLPGDDALDLSMIEAHRDTLEGIRLWDHEVLLESLRQLQEIRTYYEFVDVDDDRYVVDGRLRQTLLAPRELLPSSLPAEARTWTAERLVYTHGHGLVLAPANAVTHQGLPELWLADVPPQALHPDAPPLTAPRLYYGEATTDPVLVRTRRPELDYPTADGQAVTTYEGTGGLELGGLAHRVALALVLRELDLLTSAELVPTSRLLLHRQVVDRVRRVAPFLAVDGDPTLVIADGRLVWIVEGYTHTARWPLSTWATLEGRGLKVGATAVRNPVKALVDATDGSVRLYQVGSDPLLDAWTRALPGLIHPADELPDAVRAHLQVPEALLALQADLLTTWHMTDPRELFTREDAWAIPQATRQVRSGREAVGTDGPMRPYHVVLTLPGEDAPEFVAMLPLTPAGKPNLTAWLVARNDGEAYGRLRVYRFPKDRLVYGPAQVAARIRQDDAISEKITLWGQQGSRVVLGTLQVIPVGTGLLYVQPLYLRADDDAIPELTRVIVAHADRVAMGRTLDEAVASLVGVSRREPTGEAPRAQPPTASSGPPEDRLAEVQRAWREVEQARSRGDWEALGKGLEALGTLLEEDEPATPEE